MLSKCNCRLGSVFECDFYQQKYSIWEKIWQKSRKFALYFTDSVHCTRDWNLQSCLVGSFDACLLQEARRHVPPSPIVWWSLNKFLEGTECDRCCMLDMRIDLQRIHLVLFFSCSGNNTDCSWNSSWLLLICNSIAWNKWDPFLHRDPFIPYLIPNYCEATDLEDKILYRTMRSVQTLARSGRQCHCQFVKDVYSRQGGIIRSSTRGTTMLGPNIGKATIYYSLQKSSEFCVCMDSNTSSWLITNHSTKVTCRDHYKYLL